MTNYDTCYSMFFSLTTSTSTWLFYVLNFKYLLRLKIINTHTNAKRTDSNWSLIKYKEDEKLITNKNVEIHTLY